MDVEAACFDVAIIGGGPAGAAAAINLSRLGRKVILLEQSNYGTPKIGETIPPSAKLLLNILGVWTAFKALGSIPSYGIQSAWGGNDLISNSFIHSPYGSGWHIDRKRFDVMLVDAAAKKGTTILTSSHVTDIVSDPRTGWMIEYRSGNEWKANEHTSSRLRNLYVKAIINAAGRTSILGHKLGARQIICDSLVGLAVRFKDPAGHTGSFILLEPSELGWWYSSAIPGAGVMAVFMTDADIMVKNRLGQLEEWMKNLEKTEHTKEHIRNCNPVWGPRIFCASSRKLSRSSYEGRWLAVGDAAMAVDPLSSSGIPFALRSGMNGAEIVHRWLSGDSSAVKDYHREVDTEFERYLRLRSHYYSLETRWTDSMFWKRRRSMLERQTIRINPKP